KANEEGRVIESASLNPVRTLASALSKRTHVMLRMGSQAWMDIALMYAQLVASSAGILWWQGQQILENYTAIREQKSTQAMLSERNSGVQLATCGEQRRRCVRVNPEGGRCGEDPSWSILEVKKRMTERAK
ncbi:mobilization protein, partial [Salmonella enterica]|uniref:mobilization protein n=1 Tax=Salmonella enterica TaxID=28901 RepID=UPI00398C32B0